MKDIPEPRKRPRQSRSQQMVESILDATARILAKHGYAGTNTNIVAERAGVSVGSIYQYFPNKDALVVAVHERHVQQMCQVIETILKNARSASLREHIAAIVRALLAAHLIEPQLHQVLEKELPFFDPRNKDIATHKSLHHCLNDLLEEHQSDIMPADNELAIWVVMHIIVSMIHAAVIFPPKRFVLADIEQAIISAVMGYLIGTGGASGLSLEVPPVDGAATPIADDLP